MSLRPSKSKKKGQPSPLSFFLLPLFAFIFDAPFAMVVLLLVIAIIVWRVQSSSKKMAHLPPLPPVEHDASRPDGVFTPLPHELKKASGPADLSDTSWGRQDAPAPIVTPPPAPNPWTPSEANRPSPAAQPLSTEPSPSWEPTPEPLLLRQWDAPAAVSPTPRSASVASAYRSKTARRGSALGINLATEAGLRQAVIAMTVLGPCRAMNPYQEEGPIAARQLNERDRQQPAAQVPPTTR